MCIMSELNSLCQVLSTSFLNLLGLVMMQVNQASTFSLSISLQHQ